MRRIFTLLLFCSVLLLGLVPMLLFVAGKDSALADRSVLVTLNLVSWSLILTLLLAREELRGLAIRVARSFGIEPRYKGFEQLMERMLRDMHRLHGALVVPMEKQIANEEELSRTLERVTAHAYQLLKAESAELALFDRESGSYHSSFVLGKPFRSNAQAMLSGAAESERPDKEISPDVLVEAVAFCGTVLGTLRVALTRGTIPSPTDREIMRLLALQTGLAILNAEYTKELARMRRHGDESLKAKTGFLANLSHEIRGPLGIMLNAVELVLDGLTGAINDDQKETLSMVKNNGSHLLDLINDVLDYAKIESGKMVATPTALVADDLLIDLANVVRSQAETKSHVLQVKPSPEALVLSCDKRHARQILINILTNAIKYTPEGGKIEVWAERVSASRVRLNVKDSGVGIDEKDREKVFMPFERLNNSYSVRQIGSGLGMSLTKKLVEANGGSMNFTSVQGQGSHFFVDFMQGHQDAHTIKHEQGEIEAPVQGQGERILIVHPQEDERTMLLRYLVSRGFRAAVCAKLSEALHTLRSEQVGVLVIDNAVIEDPDKDIVRTIRDAAISKTLPIVLLTSRAFSFDVEKFLRWGVDRCLSKPFELKALGAICKALATGTYQGPRTDEDSAAKTPSTLDTGVFRMGDRLH